jgi:hypothetical protein
MNGSTENAAHGAPETPERRDVVVNLATARGMLPLVRQIVADVLHHQRRLAELLPEQQHLDRRRRTLSWPERSRRYQVQEEAVAAERNLQEALAELAGLGVVLVEPGEGQVGFPTVVNGRRAYFSWRQGEDGVHFWHFPEQNVRRPIPASWVKEANLSLASKS